MKKVFLDCGACQCKVTRHFLKKGNVDWAYYLFEPLERVYVNYQNLIKDYPQSDINYFQSAVWIEDGTTDFYLCKKGSQGSTILKEKFSNKVDHENPIKVETIDFSSWIKNNLSKEDYILLKIDIEGAEYEVLGKMIDDGTMDYIDKLIVEFHGRKKMKHTQRHKELYEKIKKYLIENHVETYDENGNLIFN